MRRRRGQVAIEYLVLMGFVMLLIAPLLIVYYNQTTRIDIESTDAMVKRASSQIVDAADTVYYLGAPSLRTITVDLPDHIESLSISGNSITLKLSLGGGGLSDQVVWSVANLTGGFGITKGPHILVVSALQDGRVNITEQK